MKTTVKITSYNIHGQELRAGNITFDFENKEVTTEKNTYSVINDYEYTYKIHKKDKKILSVGGIDGFYKFINEINDSKSPFNPAYTDLFISEF